MVDLGLILDLTPDHNSVIFLNVERWFLFPFTSFLASFDKGSRHDMTHSQYCSYGFMVITGVHDILIWIIQRNGSGKRLGESYNFEKPDDALLPYRRHPLCHNDCVLLGETFS